MKSSSNSGFVYAATGLQYRKEALISAQSVKKQMPKASISLFTDEPMSEGPFDEVFVEPLPAEGHKGIKLYKPHALLNSPYETTVFLDSDTYMCSGCEELFEVSEHAELALVHDTADMSNPIVDGKSIPGIHPYNSGVLVFRKTDKIARFLKNWYEVLQREHQEHPWDQRAMMTALIRTKIQVYCMQPIYNCRTNFIVALPQLPVKIIHGRAIDFVRTERELNRILKNRVWMPKRNRVLEKKRRSFIRKIIQKSIHRIERIGP